MTQYAWQALIDHLEDQGPARVVKIFKVGLQEMPRLERAFLSSNPTEHQQARNEILALFHRVDIEMQKAMQNSELSQEDFIKEIKKHSNFTPEEWVQLSRIPELIGRHYNELFAKRAFNTPKKRSPYFKV